MTPSSGSSSENASRTWSPFSSAAAAPWGPPVTCYSAAGCVRHTVEDAIAEGFRPIIVREAVGDRVPGVVAWNLFDMDAKFGDVEPLTNVIDYLNNLPPFAQTQPKTLGDPLPVTTNA